MAGPLRCRRGPRDSCGSCSSVRGSRRRQPNREYGCAWVCPRVGGRPGRPGPNGSAVGEVEGHFEKPRRRSVKLGPGPHGVDPLWWGRAIPAGRVKHQRGSLRMRLSKEFSPDLVGTACSAQGSPGRSPLRPLVRPGAGQKPSPCRGGGEAKKTRPGPRRARTRHRESRVGTRDERTRRCLGGKAAGRSDPRRLRTASEEAQRVDVVAHQQVLGLLVVVSIILCVSRPTPDFL